MHVARRNRPGPGTGQLPSLNHARLPFPYPSGSVCSGPQSTSPVRVDVLEQRHVLGNGRARYGASRKDLGMGHEPISTPLFEQLISVGGRRHRFFAPLRLTREAASNGTSAPYLTFQGQAWHVIPPLPRPWLMARGISDQPWAAASLSRLWASGCWDRRDSTALGRAPTSRMLGSLAHRNSMTWYIYFGTYWESGSLFLGGGHWSNSLPVCGHLWPYQEWGWYGMFSFSLCMPGRLSHGGPGCRNRRG